MLKHKTKKIGIALLISVMVFALCACGGNTESEGSSELVVGKYILFEGKMEREASCLPKSIMII